jgi:hypothetical protein
MSIAAQLIAEGKTKETGAVPPELAFDPEDVFEQLREREIHIHEQVNCPPRDGT